jgi:MSHA biogenesis protein MshJ
MNKYYKLFLSYEKKVNFLSLRERILLFLAILGLVFYLWQVLILDTMFGSQTRIIENIKLVKKQVGQLTEQINVVAELIRLQPTMELTERINLLKQEKKNYEDSITTSTKQLIPPKEMAKLLEGILEQDNELSLIQMENLPVEPVFKQPDATKERISKEEEQKAQIYRHGLKLEFIGTYFATKHFLQALEKLPWKLLWDEFHYEVKDYPFASVQIVIYTLSLQKSCLGM